MRKTMPIRLNSESLLVSYVPLAFIGLAALAIKPYRYPAGPGRYEITQGKPVKKVYASRRRAPATTRQNLSGQISQNQSTVQVTPPGD